MTAPKPRVMLVASVSTFGGILHRVFDYMEETRKHPGAFDYYLYLLQPNDLTQEFLREQGIPFRAGLWDPAAIQQAVEDWSIDLVHLHNLVGKTKYRMALSRTGVHIVEQERGATWNRGTEKCLESILTHHLVDGFLANCRAGRVIMQKRLKVKAEQVNVIYNGLNTRFFDETSHRELPETGDKRIVLSVGRLDTPKGLFSLLGAVPSVVQAVPEAEFWLVGKGPLRTVLEKEAERLGVTEHIRFWGAQKYMADFYRVCELSVLVSNREPFPNALVEASYFGRPVIGTWVDGMADVVEDGVTGYLLPGKVPVRRGDPKAIRVARWVVDGQTGKLRRPLDVDPDALAAKIIYLLQHPDEAKAMGERGRKKVTESFSMERHVQEMESYYLKILGHNK